MTTSIIAVKYINEFIENSLVPDEYKCLVLERFCLNEGKSGTSSAVFNILTTIFRSANQPKNLVLTAISCVFVLDDSYMGAIAQDMRILSASIDAEISWTASIILNKLIVRYITNENQRFN